MKKILFMMFLLIGISACSYSGRNSEKNSVDDQKHVDDIHNARNSLDYQGTYTGTTPDAKSSVVNIMIVLTADEYLIKLTPLKENAKTTTQRGNYMWDKNGRIITLEGVKDTPSKYFVGENHLIQLDASGKQREGKDAQHYILRKQWE